MPTRARSSIRSPKAGEKVDKGSKVDIVVSSGPETDSVPGVVGKTESDATNTLSNAGFSVNVESGGTSDTYAKGYVMKQSPTGTAKKGSTVTIYISEGKDTSSDEVDVDSLGLYEHDGRRRRGSHCQRRPQV